MACEECQTRFNIVTLGIPLRIAGIPEQDFERLIDEFSRAGEFCMRRFSQRLRRFYIIPKEKGVCANCQKETNLVMESKFDGQKYCSACARSYIFGKIARQEVAYEAKRIFKIPLKTFIDLAFTAAQSMMNAWLSNNWGKILKKNEFQRKFKECKESGIGKEPVDEPQEIQEIRNEWRETRALISPFRHFLFYWLGQDITKKNRKKRRERLRGINELLQEKPKEISSRTLRKIEAKKEILRSIEQEIKKAEGFLKVATDRKQKKTIKEELQRLKRTRVNLGRKVMISEGKAKTTEIVKRIATPICEGCENYREYDWGPECQLDREFRKIRPDRIPSFPTTKVKYSKGMYKFIRVELGLWKISIGLWERGKRKEGLIIGTRWIEEYHKAERVFGDPTRYPELFRHIGKGQKKEYFFIFPLTKVVPLKEDQGWLHIIAYCLETTCVLSIKEDQRKVRFFRHKEIISIKNYYFKQRKEASRGYFKKPRLKESRKIKWVLHNETKGIAEYLMTMPGKVILLNIQKRLYRRGEIERRELNRKLRYWIDSIFRARIGYKLEMRGFPVEEREFNANQVAVCPYCEKEIGGTWQNLVIVEDRKSLTCECGRDTNTNLAIALVSMEEPKTN